MAKSQTQLSNFYFSHPIHSSQTFKLPTQHNLANLQLFASYLLQLGFPRGSAGKESACSEGDLGSTPGLGRSPGGGKGYPLQDSGLENPMDCTAHGVAKSQTRLSDFHFHFAQQLRKVGTINVSCFTDEELKQKHSVSKG